MEQVDDSSQLSRLEELVVQNPKHLFTLVSLILVLVIYVNLNTLQSPILGLPASIVYFIINGVFLGHAFFKEEAASFQLLLGILLAIMLLGFLGWLAVALDKIDLASFTLVLLLATTFSSLLNRKVKGKNAS